MAIHNIFHISILKSYQNSRLSSQIKAQPPPSRIAVEDEDELDQIIDSQLYFNRLQYRANLKLKRYLAEYDKVSYPADNLSNAEYSDQPFHQWDLDKLGMSLDSTKLHPTCRTQADMRPIWPIQADYSRPSEIALDER